MRLLLDECVSSRATAEALAGDGIEVLRATQVMAAGSLDEDLIAWCGREDAYLLTADTFRRGGALEHRLIRATVIQFRVGVFVYHARAEGQ
jgi:predicted nuclease of predicted toxin-antitoxin system